MRSRQVWRHTCDHCGKSLLQRPAMERHEAHCTMNPDRKCRMCELIDALPAAPARELAAMLTRPPMMGSVEDFDAWRETCRQQFAALQERVQHCPACTLAALRQAGIHGSEFDWDFGKAREEFMKQIPREYPGY